MNKNGFLSILLPSLALEAKVQEVHHSADDATQPNTKRNEIGTSTTPPLLTKPQTKETSLISASAVANAA
jgi:hypothetical protein